MIRAVDRNMHADDVLDAGTPLAGRSSTVRDRLDRPVGKVAAFCAAMPSTTFRQRIGQVPTLLVGTVIGRAGGEHVYDVGAGQMTQPRLHGTDPPKRRNWIARIPRACGCRTSAILRDWSWHANTV